MVRTVPQGRTSAAPLRLARGTVAGLTCGVGAVLAHTAAGGALASSTALVFLIGTSIGLGIALSGRAHDPAGLGALALITQVGWHGLQMVTAPTTAAAAPTGDHLHHVAHGTADTTGAVSMAFAHLLVAAATVLVCLGADRVLLDLARETLHRLVGRVPSTPSLGTVQGRVCRPIPTRRAPRLRHDRSPAPTRGPPTGCVLAA